MTIIVCIMIELKLTKRDPQKDSAEYLRSQGHVPAVCYGGDFENTLVSVDDIEFRKVYRETGTSGIITTTGDIAGEQCLVQDMQAHVVTGDLLHIDFKILTKGETTEVTIPVEIIGTSPVVENKQAILNISNNTVDIETIPSKIPESIQIDISTLVNIGDSIKVSDLNLGEGIEILDDADMTLVSVVVPKENEVEEDEPTDVSMEPELVDQKGKEESEENAE